MNKFARIWNTTGKTWIDVKVPGPWAIDNSLDKSWGIINTVTGKTKRIGPASFKGVNHFDRAKEEANRRNGALLPPETATDYAIRFVVTIPNKNGIGRTMMLPAQGRYTYATSEEAQAWIDGYLNSNDQARLDEFGRDLQVRACKCYPGHFDPMNIYFDMPAKDELIAMLKP